MIYLSLEDILCEWGAAMSAIMKYSKEKEPLKSAHGWNFLEGTVVNHHRDGYSVSVTFSGYDEDAADSVHLHVQAQVSAEGNISVFTTKRH